MSYEKTPMRVPIVWEERGDEDVFGGNAAWDLVAAAVCEGDGDDPIPHAHEACYERAYSVLDELRGIILGPSREGPTSAYDGKTPSEIVDDYVLVRGDLSDPSAREQFVREITKSIRRSEALRVHE